MVKAISFFKRKSGLSVEGFQEYWRTAHAELVVKMPGIRRYVQSHTRLAGYRKGEAFQKYWRDVHGPLAALIPVVRRYVQSHTRRAIYESGRTPPYDGVALTWFDDTQAMRLSAAPPGYAPVRAGGG